LQRLWRGTRKLPGSAVDESPQRKGLGCGANGANVLASCPGPNHSWAVPLSAQRWPANSNSGRVAREICWCGHSRSVARPPTAGYKPPALSQRSMFPALKNGRGRPEGRGPYLLADVPGLVPPLPTEEDWAEGQEGAASRVFGRRFKRPGSRLMRKIWPGTDNRNRRGSLGQENLKTRFRK